MRRNKKLVKVLTGTLATAMLVSGTIPAYAATGTSGTTSTGSVVTQEAVEGTNAVNVYAEIGSSYTVTIPKTITLDGSTKTGAYTVSVAGDIAGNEVVNVVPDTSFSMSQTGKADVTASIEQDKTSWKVAEFGTNGAGSITASGLTAGAWNGTFNFNVGLEEEQVYGEDVALTSDNLSTYGIAREGDVVIPEYVTDSEGVKHKVTSIGGDVFYGCHNLTSVTIPNSVTSIGNGAFASCTSLTSIEIPDSVTSIDNSAFYGCNGLTSVTIPDSVTSIGSQAFYKCSSLTSIEIPDSVTSIGFYAFNGCNSLISATISNSVTSIENGVFESCNNLVSINIPDGVTSIGYRAFYGCSLTSITIPSSVTSIGDSAFEGCSSLTSVVISEGVTNIGDKAFYDCKKLPTSIAIPVSVKSIGDYAFANTGLWGVTYNGQSFGRSSKFIEAFKANGGNCKYTAFDNTTMSDIG